MINRKVMSMCPTIDYCKGWNDAVDEIKNNGYVVFIDKELHDSAPEYYPAIGTVGKIINEDEDGYEIQWPNNSTKGKGIWRASEESIIKLHF